MASVISLKRRRLTIVLTYVEIVGYGKVRYRLVCTSTTHSFSAPKKATVRRIARDLGLERFTEESRTNTTTLENQTFTILCTLLAGSTREAREHFTRALHAEFKY